MEKSVFHGTRIDGEKLSAVRRGRNPGWSRAKPPATTLLDLVQVVQGETGSDEEVVAVISHLLLTRQVVLCGTFAGCRLSSLAA